MNFSVVIRSRHEIVETIVTQEVANSCSTRPLEGWWCRTLDRLSGCRSDECSDSRRITRLQVGFSLFGIGFGLLYVLFYAAIAHWYGAGIIAICVLAVAAVIPLLRLGKSTIWTGHWLSLVLLIGFSALTLVEGGMNGHAIAWLAAVPLCSLMLLPTRAAIFWAGATLMVLTALFIFTLMGAEFAPTYDQRWHLLITGMGLIGLGPFLFAIVLTFEITRRRAVAARDEAQAGMEEANARLLHLNEEKDQFLGIVAHDLRNPLGIIVAYADLITMKEPLPEPQNDHLERIKGSALRMSGILDDLLNINAIEQGRFPIHPAVHNLNALVAESVERFELNAAKKSITIELIQSAEENLAEIDSRALGQVLDNLLSNAVKYSETGCRVQVVSRQGAGQAVLEIIDEGPGFSEEDRQHLYERFAKLSAKPTGGETSTGLGLSIVKRITEVMGGAIECLPNQPNGTCFRLQFPGVVTGQPATSNQRLQSGHTLA